MRRLIWIVLAILPGFVAIESSADDLGKNFEASVVVTGTITVNPDGSVNSYTLDQRDKLPPAAKQITDATVPRWKFRPVLGADGKAVLAQTQMSMRIVARPIDKQHATIRISGTQFGRDAWNAKSSPECADGACLIAKKRQPPLYPIGCMKAGISGTVYLVQEIGRDGRVDRQAVRQVNLRDWGNPECRAKTFAEASLNIARDWTYDVPTSGDEAKRDHWTVAVPVDFTLNGTYAYGQWNPYRPGPIEDIPWAKGDTDRTALNGTSDAIPDNGAFVADSRFVLLTPPSPG